MNRALHKVVANLALLGTSLWVLVVVVATAPLWLVLHLRAKAAIRRFTRGARFHEGLADARIIGDSLAVHTSKLVETPDKTLTSVHADHHFALASVARVERTHVVGDAGFADANAIHYLLRIVLEDAQDLCIWVYGGAKTDATLFEPLRAAARLEDRPAITGLLRGIALPLCVMLGAIWLVAVIAVVRWRL